MEQEKRGYTRSPGAAAPDALHQVIARNATEEDLRASQARVGTTVEIGPILYRCARVYKDDLNRLIAVVESSQAVAR